MISDKERERERESERLREGQKEKEREVSKIKYLEGAREQGGLRLRGEQRVISNQGVSDVTDQRFPIQSSE